MKVYFFGAILLILTSCNIIVHDEAEYATKILLTDSIELSLYSPTMFRFRVSKLDSVKFPDKYEIPFLIGHFDKWEPVKYEFEESDNSYFVETERIKIFIDKTDMSWIIQDKEGGQIFPSNGEVYGMFKDGYTVFDNASAFDETNLNSRFTHWFYNPLTGSYTDVFLEDDLIEDKYFIYGPDYPSLFKQFNDLVGPEPMLPRKAYGFFQTQHLPCDANQEDFMEMAHEFRKRDIPCDNLIIDFGWGDACDGDKEVVWGSRMDWSSNYLQPLSPKEMVDSLLGMNYNIMLIHHSAPDHQGRFNHGWTETLVEENLWWKKYKEKLDLCIAGTWQDTRRNNITDAEIWNGTQKYIGSDKRVLFMGCRRMQETNPWGGELTQIPVNAMIGSRRYPFRWVGDSDFTWSEMRWQINAITNTHGSMKGMSYLTWDVYGKTPQIQARMNQFVDFLGVSRSHNLKPWSISSDINQWKERIVIERNPDELKDTKNAERVATENEFTAENSIRRHRKLRYSLLPYIYSNSFDHYFTGMPICRPMLLEFPEDENCNKDQWPYQYMFGSSFLVAPVFHEKTTHNIYLPQGKKWYDYWTKEVFDGSQVIQYNTTDIEKLPLLVPEGSIITYGKKRNWIIEGEKEDTLWVEVYPGKDGYFKLIEDDGHSLDYQQGKFASTLITSTCNNDELVINIGKIKGDYNGKITKRYWIVRIVDVYNEYSKVMVNGKEHKLKNAKPIEYAGLVNESQIKEFALYGLVSKELEIIVKK